MKVWQAFLGIGAVAALAYLATLVGGIAIRRASDGSELTISEPVVLNVPAQVTWAAPSGVANSPITLRIRSTVGEETVGEGMLGDERAVVIFPCSLVGEASLILRDERTQQQLGVLQPVEYLAPGPDCLQ